MKVTVKTGYNDCEFCGYYDWIVFETDKRKYYADNHLGPGLPCDISEYGTPSCNDSWAQGYIRALKDMGYDVELEVDSQQ